jgi:general secretion pathway protein G
MMWPTKNKVAAAQTRDKEAGVTLLELLVVMVILTLLATLVAPRVMGYLGRSKTDVARAQMSSLSTALELYYLDVGSYPSDEDGLINLIEAPEDEGGWQGPYLRNGDASGLIDPWDREYGYVLDESGSRFTLTSLGRDGEVDGEGEDRDLIRS